jgi:hypothetical protein
MGYPAVTNTFVESSTAYATAVNQNFLDVINGISDGTKDIRVNNATVAGSLALSSQLTSRSVIPATTDIYDIGSAAGAFNNAYINQAYLETAGVSGAGHVYFRETGNYISSDNSGYLDFRAGTAIRFNSHLDSFVVSGLVDFTSAVTFAQSATFQSGLKSVGVITATSGIQFSGSEQLSTFASGSFVVELEGCLSAPSGTAYYHRIGNCVTIKLPQLTGISSAIFGLSGATFPDIITPSIRSSIPCVINWSTVVSGAIAPLNQIAVATLNGISHQIDFTKYDGSDYGIGDYFGIGTYNNSGCATITYHI